MHHHPKNVLPPHRSQVHRTAAVPPSDSQDEARLRAPGKGHIVVERESGETGRAQEGDSVVVCGARAACVPGRAEEAGV